MKRLPRHIIATVLALMFLAIAFSPLASIGLHYPLIAHAITGECTGDCDTCGCSMERRASQTCCCWLNKLKKQSGNRVKLVCHCKNSKKHSTSSITATCPCGGGKHLVLWGDDEMKILPCHFDGEIALLLEEATHHSQAARFIDRSTEPAVPPPKSSIIL